MKARFVYFLQDGNVLKKVFTTKPEALAELAGKYVTWKVVVWDCAKQAPCEVHYTTGDVLRRNLKNQGPIPTTEESDD